MKFKNLYTSLAIASVAMFATQANAVWLNNNLRDGLQLGIHGSVTPSVTKNTTKFSYYSYNADPTGQIVQALVEEDKRMTDERARLSGFNSAAIWFGAYKQLTRDVTLSGNIGLYGNLKQYTTYNYSPAYQYGLTLSHDKYGSLGIKSDQSTNSSIVTTSGVNGILDTPSSSITAEFTYIPGLTVAAYHAFPSAQDTYSLDDTDIHKGHGISASYTHAFEPRHKLTGAIGYTNTNRHAELNSDTYAKQKKAHGVGLRYQYEDLTLSANYGEATETFDAARVFDNDVKAYGIRLAYEVTPRIETYATYGRQTSDKTAAVGQALDYAGLASETRRGISESNYFDKVDRTSYGIGASYEIYRNLTLRGTASQTETENYISEGLFSKRKVTNYSIGATFSF